MESVRPPHTPKKPAGAGIHAIELVKSFGETRALRGVSLNATPGEIIAITGPSGSGKSTLLLCMAGILRPDAGEVWFDDCQVDAASEQKRSEMRRTDFGVLFQFGQTVAEMTAAENVALPLFLSGHTRREALRAAHEWLDRVGVAHLAAVRPTHMSGGQAQRVALARALVTQPAILFADEPTGALDIAAGEQVLAELKRSAHVLGTTVLLVTHEAKVATYADREVQLVDGVVQDAVATRAVAT